MLRVLRVFLIFSLIIMANLLLACSQESAVIQGVVEQTDAVPSRTPFQPIAVTQTSTLTITPTPEVVPVILSDALPPRLRAQLILTEPYISVDEGGVLQFDLLTQAECISEQVFVEWIYVLVAPFPTIEDGISFEELFSAWTGGSDIGILNGKPLLLTEATKNAFEGLWGAPAAEAIEVLPADQLLEAAWSKSAWALVEFEDLEPRWKVLRINNHSPLDKDFDTDNYPLTICFGWKGDPVEVEQAQEFIRLPFGNRDPEKMTVVVMTGVTALTRATGWKMELNGMEYPARDIFDWLHGADILHISNEVSFTAKCGAADPNQPSLMFCSAPKYIELLEYVGADVIELTGNHNMDYGLEPFIYSLELYQQRGFKIYAGGMDVEEARRPLLLEHNGNHIAFMGCNYAGPARVWATNESPGEAQCDYDFIDEQLASLVVDGYLPIFTYQYDESYSPSASTPQKEEFRDRAEAGAIIVQGSQAHRPQGMEFAYGAFIHHGLGNLFFDQMEVTGVTGTRDEFIDRHVFYDGRYISVELLTAKLEDYARPRPMTQNERQEFLEHMFNISGW